MFASNENFNKENQSKNSGSNRNGLFFQPKLTVNQPNDAYEQEADAVAEKVMRMEAPVKMNHSFRLLILQIISRPNVQTVKMMKRNFKEKCLYLKSHR